MLSTIAPQDGSILQRTRLRNVFSFIENIFDQLNRHDNHVVIVAVFFALVVILVVLRLASHLHFRGTLIAFRLDARREIKNRGDIKNIKNSLLRKAAAEYIRTADRAVTMIQTNEIVGQAVSGMKLIGWKYDSILPLIEGMEMGMLFIGLILALVFTDYAAVYGLLAIVSFIFLRLFASFFNARGARGQLITEMILFIDREIGRFFAADSGGAILRLKNDLTEAIDRQAAAYTKTMENISATMSATLKEISTGMIAAANSIGPIVAKSMDEKIVDMNSKLTETIEAWEKAITESGEMQKAMNESAEGISHASNRLKSSAELMTTHMQGHSKALSEQLVVFVGSIDSLKEGLSALSIYQDNLSKQASYIEKNQIGLDAVISSYEASIHNLTETLGNALGAYLSIHTQTAADTLSQTLKANVDRIVYLAKGGKDSG